MDTRIIKSIDELNGKLNGIEELKTFAGTRKEIYNLIAEKNPLAIIDYRQAFVKIENTRFLVILKKVKNQFAINIIWDLDDHIQYYNM